MKYIGKKLLTLILTLFFISVLVFFIFQVIPGDPALSILGTEATDEKVEALREQLGLNAPLPQRYFNWFTGVLRGDLGKSYRYQESLNEQMAVSRLIAGQAAGYTYSGWPIAASYYYIFHSYRNIVGRN